MKLRHALMMALMIVTVAGIAHAVSPEASTTAAPAPAVVVAAPAAADAATDPYLNASEITTESGRVARTCMSFSYQCQYDGGPCSPVAGACICGTANGSLICGSTH
ncbi:MAG TPA: hypothetical protein VFQ07_00640 [Candidatus Polarisedimenticolia bacterium]|nr:hypothetical protein [Candidatus Polarisedimenticolia bacterium]